MVSRGASREQQDAWGLAVGLAGRSRVRVATWNGRKRKWEYPAGREEDLTDQIPTSPAAVMLYNSHGQCRTLVVDVDVDGPDCVQVTHEVVALLERCGARVIVDRGPSGRHHVYVPLRDGLGVEDSSRIVKALARRFPGIDPLPHATGAVSGCIRPPGSPYKDGKGCQELVTDLDDARRLLVTRNGVDVLRRLEDELSGELAELRREVMTLARPVEDLEAEASVLSAPFVGRVLSPRMATLAHEGTWEAAGYPSRSEARMAVLCAAVRAGLAHKDVAARMEDGRWAGLVDLFANASARGRLLSYEWRKALAMVGAGKGSGKSVRHCNTSEGQVVTRGDHAGSSARDEHDTVVIEHRYIRRFRAVLGQVDHQEFTGKAGLHARFLLRALAAAAHQKGTRAVSFGVRSLSLAMPVDASTVSRVLRELREAADPWITLVQRGEGTAADVYELRIPDRYADVARDADMVAGKVHGLRPAFRELGEVAAFVFEAIEQGARTVVEAAVAAGVSRSAAYEAVGILESWGLVVRDDADELSACPERLGEVAERVGAAVVVGLLVERFRRERRAWIEYLSRHAVREEWWDALVAEGPPPEPGWEPEAPDERVAA